MNPTTLSPWLESLGLSNYLPLFEQNGIDLLSLPLLSEADLTELGVLLGHRKRLMKAIVELGAAVPVLAEIRAEIRTPARRAERRQLTVMFCDLVGSTELSQRLDPEALRELMQSYQQTCAGVVQKYTGHVAQYLGDGLMIYFGWPQAHEDDAERAVRSGLELIDAVKQIAVSPAPTSQSSASHLAIRIGIATGPVVVGETGNGDAAIPKAAIGETPNLAARMQSLAQAGQIMVAPSTQRLLGAAFTLVDTGTHSLKGISEPTRVWQVSGLTRAATRGSAHITPYVGREEEISLLMARWRQAGEGEGQLVLLSGEPGIGKSRITQELRERIAGETHLRLRYQCSPFYTASAFYPVAQQLTFAAGIERDDSPATKLDKLEASLAIDAADIPTVAPLMAALLSLPAEAIAARYPPRMLSPQKQKEMTLLALADQLDYLARRQPVILLFEDAHWVDPSTLDLLNVLVERLRHCAALILITARPEFVSPWAGQSHATTFSLNRLSRRQGVEIVGKVTQGKALPAEVLEIILARTDGIPLFIEELTTTILEANFLTDAGTHYTLDGPIPPLAIPSTLQDSLMARLDRLGQAKEIAQIASCIGREFRHEWLMHLSERSADELQGALDQLVASGLVYVKGAPPDAEYSFKHALVQQAAYDSLLIKRRQAIHRRIAQALQAHFADVVAARPELLARHLTDGGEIDAALPQWIAGAKLAVEQNRHAESLQHVDSGLALLERVDPAQRVNCEAALLVTATASHFATAGYASTAATRLLLRVESLLDAITDQDTLCGALYEIGAHAWVGPNDMAKARHTFERMLVLARSSSSLGFELLGASGLGTLLIQTAQYADAVPLLEFVIEHYDVQAHRSLVSVAGTDPKVTTYGFLCQHWSYVGDIDKARRYGDLALAHAAAIAHPFSLTLALALSSTNLVHFESIDEVLSMARQCIILGDEQRLPYWVGWATFTLAIAKLWDGKFDEAVKQFDLALRQLVETGSSVSQGSLDSMHSLALARAGQIDAARIAARSAYDHTTRTGERIFLPTIQYTCGIVELLDPDGDNAQAEKWFLDAIAEGHAQSYYLYALRAAVALGGLWRTQGKTREAHEVLAAVLAKLPRDSEFSVKRDAIKLLAELDAAQ